MHRSCCDYWYEKKTPALGHDWSDWEVDLEATYLSQPTASSTAPGMRCGEVETYAIPSDHHKHTTVVSTLSSRPAPSRDIPSFAVSTVRACRAEKPISFRAARPRRSAMTTAATAASARSWSRPAPRAA
ncbi:MAG: hypothetical protein ACLSHG_11745 [Oscillospiraceae bacterium]